MRERERERQIDRKRERQSFSERKVDEKRKGTGSGVYNSTAKSLPLFYFFFYYANVKKNVNCRIKEIIKCMKLLRDAMAISNCRKRRTKKVGKCEKATNFLLSEGFKTIKRQCERLVNI